MINEIKTTRPLMLSLWRGFRKLCPECSRAKLFASFLKVKDNCTACGEQLHHHRADDAPPYFTILIVGHIVLPTAMLTESTWHPSTLMHLSIWIPAILLLTFFLLPRIKGTIVALQWALRMHGFGDVKTQAAGAKL
jgi:uncharacterized protein (DUF983 family)